MVKGESVAEVLGYVQFRETVRIERMQRQLQDARTAGRLTVRESNQFLRFNQEGLKGCTNLEEGTPMLFKISVELSYNQVAKGVASAEFESVTFIINRKCLY